VAEAFRICGREKALRGNERAELNYGDGIVTATSFEYPLSVLPESTEVTT
jgi:hypothetical protein